VGSVLTGVGFFTSIADLGFAERFGNSAGVAATNNTGIDADIEAQAICASGPGISAASVRAARSVSANRADASLFAQKVASYKAQVEASR